MVGTWPRDNFLDEVCFLAFAEGPAPAILVFRVGVTAKCAYLLCFQLIPARTRIIAVLLVYSSICYLVSGAVSDIGKKVLA